MDYRELDKGEKTVVEVDGVSRSVEVKENIETDKGMVIVTLERLV